MKTIKIAILSVVFFLSIEGNSCAYEAENKTPSQTHTNISDSLHSPTPYSLNHASSMIENLIAGWYFKYASVLGHNVKAENIYQFICVHFSANTRWKKNVFNFKNTEMCYFSKHSTADIIILPLQKNGEYIFQSKGHYLDSFITFLTMRHPGFLRIHFLLIINNNSSVGHCNYASMFFQQNQKPKFCILEPSPCHKTPTPLNIDGVSITGTVVLMWNQCGNAHDCVRFSLIYLLYAISGTLPHTLSNVKVRLGFKQWIEGPNGLNSIQLHHTDNASGPVAELQQSNMSKVTGVWRHMVDIMLYYPRTTEAALVVVSIGILYYSALKFTPYGMVS